MGADGTLTLLRGCADLVSMGKPANAWQMWEDAETDQRGCSKTKEMERREKAAEANLKTKREADQAMYLAMQLGGQSALLAGSGNNALHNLTHCFLQFSQPGTCRLKWQMHFHLIIMVEDVELHQTHEQAGSLHVIVRSLGATPAGPLGVVL